MTAVSNPVEKKGLDVLPTRPATRTETLHTNYVYYGYATRTGYRPYTHVRFCACKYLLSTLYTKASASFQTSTMPVWDLIRPVWDRVSFYLISLLFAPCNKTKNEANVTLCYRRVVCKLQRTRFGRRMSIVFLSRTFRRVFSFKHRVDKRRTRHAQKFLPALSACFGGSRFN